MLAEFNRYIRRPIIVVDETLSRIRIKEDPQRQPERLPERIARVACPFRTRKRRQTGTDQAIRLASAPYALSRFDPSRPDAIVISAAACERRSCSLRLRRP